MVLRAPYLLTALKLQEAADAIGHNEVRSKLSDAINDAHRGTGKYGYYVDHTGDGESGDCVYMCDGDMRMAPYSIGSVGGKSAAHIDMESGKNVTPVTRYQEEADDDDHYASMEEALKRDGLYSALPLYERFISKKERDSAGDDDFAGKGKSFPILKPEDVQAAVHAMGRAGDKNYGASGLKSRIVAIAKRKGWTKYLPKSWQGDETKTTESADANTPADVRLVESATPLEVIAVREGAKSDYQIKLIAPGKGSSAFYPAEVLKRDGPTVFKAGTHVYVNHPTFAEESARPEGDVKNLAGVLTSDAVYHESHASGPGLYGRMKVFADHADMVADKAPHVGMSIRAAGVAESGKHKDGVPVLAKLTSAESVDIVTRAGAGGLILTESGLINNGYFSAAGTSNTNTIAYFPGSVSTTILTEAARNAATSKEDEMSEQEKQELREAARIVRESRAREIAAKALADVSLIEAGKTRVIENCLRNIPLKDSAVDEEALTEAVKAEAKREGAYLASLMGTGVRGMGAGAPVQLTEEQAKKQRKEEKRLLEANTAVFADLMGNSKAAEIAARGRAF